MARLGNPKWTLVQHSGFDYGNDLTFSRAVEERIINTEAQARKVQAAGGLVLDTYAEAYALAEKENYPDPQNMGLTPRARGHFGKEKLEGLRIYIPLQTSAGEKK